MQTMSADINEFARKNQILAFDGFSNPFFELRIQFENHPGGE
jgi:hypothetical protein